MSKKCAECGGTGKVTRTVPVGKNWETVEVEVTCPECDGSGRQ